MADASRRLRVAAWWGLGLVAGLAAIGALLWLSAPRWAGAGVVALLEARGLEAVALRLERPTWGRVVVRDLRVGEPPELAVERAELVYSLDGLLARRLDRVHVSGLTARATLARDGLQVHGLDGLDAWREGSPRSGASSGAGGGAPGPDTGRVDSLPFDVLSVDALRTTLDTPAGRFVIEGEGELRGRDLRARAELRSEDGRATARLTLAPPSAAIPAAAAGGAEPPGDDPEAVRWLPFAAEGDVELFLRDWQPTPGSPPVRADGALALRISPSGLSLPAGGAIRLESPLGLSLEARGDAPLWVLRRGDGDAEGAAFRGRLRAHVRTLAPRPGLESAAGSVDASLGGTLASLAGDVDIRLETRGLRVGDVVLDRARWSFPGRWARRGVAWELEGELASTAVAARLERRGDAPVRVGGDTPTGVVHARWEPDGDSPAAGLSGRLRTRGGALVVDAGGIFSDVRLAGLSFDGTWRTEPPALRGRLGIARADWRREPLPVAPLSASGPVAYAGRAFDFDLALDLGPEASEAGTEAFLRGRHDADTGRGEARLLLPPVAWSGSRRIQDAFPLLEGLVESATGELGGEADLRWGDGPRVSVTLEARGLDVATEGQSIHGLVGSFHYARPAHEAGPAQILRADRMRAAGITFEQPLVELRQTGSGGVLVERAEWRMLGGRVTGGGLIDLEGGEQLMSFRVEKLQLAKALELLDFEGVSGKGTVGGTIPVVRRDGRIEIRDGELFAGRRGGWLRFQRGSIPGLGRSGRPEVDHVARVLENFHYDRLDVHIDGEVTGKLLVSLRLLGSNPDMDRDQMYDLTLNNEVPLGDIVRGMTTVTTIPDEIARRLRGDP